MRGTEGCIHNELCTTRRDDAVAYVTFAQAYRAPAFATMRPHSRQRTRTRGKQ